MAKKADNIIKFPKVNRLIRGYAIMAVLVLYIVYLIFSYAAKGAVTAYEVRQGVIASNNTFKGLIIRNETVVYAPYSGKINYYVKAGTKVASTDSIYSIDTKGDVADQINAASENSTSLDTTEMESLVDSLEGFLGSYDGNDFYKVYSFKQDFSSDLSQSLSNNALTSLTSTIENHALSDTFHMETAGVDGVVAYYVDGYEDLTTSNFKMSDMTSAGYTRNALQQNTGISQGDVVCKVINSETWNVVIAISEELAQTLNNTSTVNVTFKKDDFSALASCSITKDSGQYYLILTLKSGMIRYMGDRFIELELVLGNNTGLKVPTSAIVKKTCYKIPTRCFNGYSSPYLLVRNSEKSGKTHQITPTIIYNDGNNYYIDASELNEGDIIQISDSQETYIIGTDVEVISGVYNINKGYALYRYINIISQNEDYAVVKTGVTRSISLYDHIVLDASTVTENQIIK